MAIRNPIEWGADQAVLTAQVARSAFRTREVDRSLPEPQIRRISLGDLPKIVAKGWSDFTSNRTDVAFLCLFYPLAGIVVSRLAFNHNLLPLLFPFVSGFALVGPFAAAGLYEMSRRREQGKPVSWNSAFDVLASESIAAIVKLALLMTGLFLLWLAAAMAIYHLSLGQEMPASISSFARDVFTTAGGWTMILVGGAVGFGFALVALAVSVVSFPLLLDRPVSISTAVGTSVRAVRLNPVPLLAWGAIVAGALALGAVPALLGLIVVMPVLGHATWHLYRALVV